MVDQLIFINSSFMTSNPLNSVQRGFDNHTAKWICGGRAFIFIFAFPYYFWRKPLNGLTSRSRYVSWEIDNIPCCFMKEKPGKAAAREPDGSKSAPLSFLFQQICVWYKSIDIFFLYLDKGRVSLFQIKPILVLPTTNTIAMQVGKI